MRHAHLTWYEIHLRYLRSGRESQSKLRIPTKYKKYKYPEVRAVYVYKYIVPVSPNVSIVYVDVEHLGVHESDLTLKTVSTETISKCIELLYEEVCPKVTYHGGARGLSKSSYSSILPYDISVIKSHMSYTIYPYWWVPPN